MVVQIPNAYIYSSRWIGGQTLAIVRLRWVGAMGSVHKEFSEHKVICGPTGTN